MHKGIALYGFVKSSKGSSSMIIICTAAMVLVAAALVTDITYGAVERFKLSKGAKEVARLGAAELPRNRASAEKIMKENSVKKVTELNELDIKISDTNKEITVTMGKPFEYIFLKYGGFKRKELSASVTARLSGMAEYKGIRPFAIEKQEFKYDREYLLTDSIEKREGTLRFQELNPGDGNFKSTILYGYRTTIKAGSGVYPLQHSDKGEILSSISQLIEKCRHQPPCSPDSYRQDCTKIIVLPVVDKLEKDPQKLMTVAGFTAFFTEKAYMEKQNLYIKGKYIKYTVGSRTNDAAPDFGLIGVEIIH